MAGTYEYSLNAVVGKLHDAAKANADKKVNSFIAGLKRMRLEFGDGDVLDNTGIAEDKKGSMYRGPGRYEIRFVRGGHGTMKRFKDYMKEYMKWFAGIDDFDVEDYVDENDDGAERFYTIPYEFVEGKFQANDKTDGEGEDFGQLEPISDDEEGSDGPDEKDGGEKVSREEVAKMIAQKLLDELGDKNLKIDDLLRTNPTAKDFVEMGAGDEKKVETALGSKTKDEAAENVEQLKVKPDKDKIEAAAKNEKPTDDNEQPTGNQTNTVKAFQDTLVRNTNIDKKALHKLKFDEQKEKEKDDEFFARMLGLNLEDFRTRIGKAKDQARMDRLVQLWLFGDASKKATVDKAQKRRDQLQKKLGMTEKITNKKAEDSVSGKTKTGKEVKGLESTVKEELSKFKGGAQLKDATRAQIMTVEDFKDFCVRQFKGYDVESKVKDYTSDNVIVATYYMTLEQVHAEAPIGEVKEDSDDYKVFDGRTDKNPANKGKDRYYVKNANARIVSALSKFTSVPKDKFKKVLRVEKAPLDKANDARAKKNKNFW